ncbi:MAG TPA: ribonuclease Y [Streptosporangiaceae bacterium]|nr:ribonuclease Y [Streptosporangiaceae bacterium]
MRAGLALVLGISVAALAIVAAVVVVLVVLRSARHRRVTDQAASVGQPTGSVGQPTGNADQPTGNADQPTGNAEPTEPTEPTEPAGPAEADEQEDRIRAAEVEAAVIVAQAERAAARTAERAAEQAAQARRELDEEARLITAETRQLRSDLERREIRVAERESRLDDELRKLDQRNEDLDQARKDLDSRSTALDDLETKKHVELERIAGLTANEAKAELVTTIQTQAKREAAVAVRDIENEAKKEGQQRARKIVTLAIQRLASEQTSESVVSVLHLPADEMKGRIIGREGRNIRAFETVTGVNLIIDDTPEAVLLSCFDPVRREIGKLTLERLVADGRIHPQRIEEVYEQSRRAITELTIRAGEDALIEVGITDMHPELTQLLGQLRYRTSYGQNVLKHLVESAHIAGMMASELGLDPDLLKRGTLLHDIGKALTHEVQGSHALIGAEIARRYGEHEDVVHAIEAHHNEVEVRTVEAVLTQAADAISGGRPGARRESLEAYVKRLERLEQIAQAQPGVEKVYAMQAGRELRIMVKPGAVDDIGAQVIARDVARQVQDELTYPGQIRVTVVRESRATEFAR